MASEQKVEHPLTKIITIDGPAGAGKSTIAKKLAKALHFFYLDTGAMYRALTLKALAERVDLDNEDHLYELAKRSHIDLQETMEGLHVLLDGMDVSDRIRTMEVTSSTSRVASKPKVREVMVEWQRQIGSRGNVVVEGRDTGTVVFPDAPFKFYLDANLAERARRRGIELKEKGSFIESDDLIHKINERDHMDMNRETGPLKAAEDAIVIDTTGLSIDDVTSRILQTISKHG